MNAFLVLVGRVLIAVACFSWVWTRLTNFGDSRSDMASEDLPMTAVLLVLAILLVLAGGLMVLGGFRTKLGAILLVVFLIPASMTMDFDFGVTRAMEDFMKDLAILGGLLFLIANGPGKLSVEGKSSRSK